MNKTKNFTLVAMAVRAILLVAAAAVDPDDAIACKRNSIIMVELPQPQQHRTNNSSDDIRNAMNLSFFPCIPFLD